MIRLYYSDVLSPRKACAVANYLKAPVEFIYLDLPKGEQQAPAYLAINPNGKVPTLVDGDRILWEADAVMCYLSERMGADLWPQDSSRQLDIVRWFSWDARHFGRASGALYFEHIIKPRFGIGVPDPARIAQAVGEFRRYAAVLNGHLKNRKWLVGDGLTVADFSVAVTLLTPGRHRYPWKNFLRCVAGMTNSTRSRHGANRSQSGQRFRYAQQDNVTSGVRVDHSASPLSSVRAQKNRGWEFSIIRHLYCAAEPRAGGRIAGRRLLQIQSWPMSGRVISGP